MVDEISNKTLAVLLIVAIALSLGGTLVSLNRLSSVVRGPSITGFATSTGTGTTNVTILSTGSIRFAVNNLDFGVGAVNTTGGNQVCSLASGTASGSKDPSSKCINFSAEATLKSLQIENDGNLNLSVNLTSNKNAAGFIGGGVSALEQFRFKIENNESDSCATVGPAAWADMNTTSMAICTTAEGLGFAPTRNSLLVHINITIPSDSLLTGTNQVATLTATGTTIGG